MPHNGGRLQAGFKNQFGCQFAFLNVLKGALSGPSAVSSSSNAWGQLVGADMYPTAMPPGVGAEWRFGGTRIWGDLGDEWDLYFPSQHTVILADNEIDVTGTVIAPGHIRYTIDESAPFTTYGGKSSNLALTSVRITAMSGSDWTGGIIVCAYKIGGVVVNHKALLDSGEIFTPEFLETLGYGNGHTPWGTLRFMDITGGAYNFTAKFAQRHSTSSASYQTPLYNVSYHAGEATKTLNHYVVTDFAGSPANWSDGMLFNFWMPSRPTTMTVTAVVKGSPTRFTVVGHGMTTGEKVGLNNDCAGPADWTTPFNTRSTTTGLPTDFTITRIDDDTFTIVLDSTLFADITDLRLMPIITIEGGALGPIRCFRHGVTHHFSSEFSNFASGGNITGTYDEELDIIHLSGNREAANCGWPIEIKAALCNKIGAHYWETIPHLMSSATERRLYLAEIRTHLDSALRIIAEMGNEEWNLGGSFVHQSQYYVAKATVEPRLGSAFATSSYCYGMLTSDLRDDMDAALAGTDYKTSMSMQAVSTAGSAGNIQRLQCSPISAGNPALYPGTKAHWKCIAPYLEPNILNTGAAYAGWQDALNDFVAGDTNAAYDWYLAEMLSGASREPLNIQLGHIEDWIADLASYGGDVCLYEFNGYVHATSLDNGFPTGGITVQNVIDFEYGWSESPQFGRLITRALNNIRAEGVHQLAIYIVGECHGSSNAWGLLDTSTIGSIVYNPAWRAAMADNEGKTRYFLPTS